jgi:oligosaccharyltransferase complex subunit alpha (ribophorin I)
MRSLTVLGQCAAALLSFSPVIAAASSSSNTTIKLLPSSFTPPQVFENSNLVRNVNLEKGYPRETINVVIQNVDQAPQSEYYLLFGSDIISQVGSLDVRDKKNTEAGSFKVELAQYQSSK